jgi:methyl-accepting chemotaxis protein
LPLLWQFADRHDGERKIMKRLVFVAIATAALGVSACSRGNPDAVENAEINQPQAEQLNEIASQAAEDAANAQAAANNAQQAANEANAVADNTTNPKEADEQNVSGM